MFRLNDDFVIDATITGGLARYVNHCCDPNCVAETVSLEKDQKIIIIANKRILKGEEVSSMTSTSHQAWANSFHVLFLAHLRLQVRLRGREQQDIVLVRLGQLQEVDELDLTCGKVKVYK